MTTTIDYADSTSKLKLTPIFDGSAPALVDLLLRDRPHFLQLLDEPRHLKTIARTMIVTAVISAAIFGGCLGAFRGGLQIPFASIKLPLTVLLTACLAAPSLTALGRVVTGSASAARDFALVLSSLAVGTMVVAALGPVVLLASFLKCSYHTFVLITCAACSIGGSAGLALFVRGLVARKTRGTPLIAASVLLVFAIVGVQMAWTLRPFILRPQTTEVPFLRAREGNFFESVRCSFDSARGEYSDSSCISAGGDLK